MINNENKIAVIFGVRNDASIAFNVALKLKASGCYVFMSYVGETKDDVLHLMTKHGFNTNFSKKVDVRNEHEIEAFLMPIYQHFGKIDYILHAIAFGSQNVMCYSLPGSNATAPAYIDIPFDELMDSFNISSYSLLRISRVAEPLLAENASLLTLTFNASQKVFPGYAGMAINKAALENIMLYLADYFKDKKVRVNAISAGLVMTTSSGGINGVRKLRKAGKVIAPLGNVTAEDVANTALYYFSNLSTKVTGNIHFVDGGFNIMGVPAHES